VAREIPVKVLIADDETGVLDSTGALLREMGYSVVTTADHRKVPLLIRTESPSLLLLDVVMPGMEIRAFVKLLRDDPSTRAVPIILFSAGFGIDDGWWRLEVEDFLPKPFRPSDLAEAVERAIGASTRGSSKP